MKNAPRKFQIKTFKKQLEAPTNEAQRKMRLTLSAEEEAKSSSWWRSRNTAPWTHAEAGVAPYHTVWGVKRSFRA
jgi:hypothetical protein